MNKSVRYESVRLQPDASLSEPLVGAIITPQIVTVPESGDKNLSSTLNVLTVEAQDSNHAMMVGPPWFEYVRRPDAADRYRVWADVSGARLQIADVPGMNTESAGLPAQLRREISGGTFDSVAAMQWQALRDKDGTTYDELSLIGYSMGAHVVAGLLMNAPEGVQANRVILWEALSDQQPLGRLVGKFALEAARSERYLKENPAWMQQQEKLSEAFPGNRKDYMAYAKGISKGRLSLAIREARDKEILAKDTELIIVNGENSRISSPEDNMRLAHSLRNLGFSSIRHIELLGESHSMINSTPRMAVALEKVLG